MDSVKFGQRVRQARRDAHMTQDELAARLGLTRIFVGYIERGTRTVSIETLLQLCDVLKVDAEWLLHDSLTYLHEDQPPQENQ